MMGGRPAIAAPALVVSALVALLMLRNGAVRPAPSPELEPESALVALTEPVSYCAAAQAALPHGRIQLLVDSSGPMMGIRPSVDRAVRWLDRGISRLRSSAVVVDELRVTQFDRKKGIRPSPTVELLLSDYRPSGETTLHEAIHASRGYDLTFILTDGLTAAREGGGACAAGVDAACVARALRDAVHVDQISTVAPEPGIWLIPLCAWHSGAFFTGKPVAEAKFDRMVSLRKVRDDVSAQVSISAGHPDSKGNLIFEYTGPRLILVVVIAHAEDLGRRAVAALRAQMVEDGVTPAASMHEASSGTVAVLPAIELYPGYLSPLVWDVLRAPNEKATLGTIEASIGAGRRITLECDRSRRNEGDFELDAGSPRSTGPCVDIYQLPSFELGFVGRTPRDQAALGSLMPDYQHASSRKGERFFLTLQCGDGASRPCASDPVRVTWMAHGRYTRALSTEPRKASAADALLRSIATNDPVTQPDRLYGLDSLVSIFFDEVREDRRRIPLGDLELCDGKVQRTMSSRLPGGHT